MTVAPGRLEHFNIIENIRPGHVPGLYIRFLMRSFLSELKNVILPLHYLQQLPRRLMLGTRLLASRTAASHHCHN